MQETQLLMFLVSLAALLGTASVLGMLARRIGCAPVVGELLAGIVIGKTVLGRFSPDAFGWLFRDGPAGVMLQGYRTVAVVLLLLLAGLEIDTRTLRRSSRTMVFTSVLGAALPFVLGYGLGLILPDSYLIDPAHRGLHAAFLGIALAISALPVITRTLLDLDLLRTEIGALVLSSAVVDDILGWTCFGALVRAMGIGANDGHGILISLGLTAGCFVLAVAIIRPLATRWLGSAEQVSTLSPTSRALSMIMVVALLGASAAEVLGAHVVFGGFIVGLALGGLPHLRGNALHVLQTCVTSLFTPVFFATMALRHDFIAQFDLALVIVVVLVASIAKVDGCALGARLGGIAGRTAWAVGFGMNSRGAMEILLANIALEAGIIAPRMFVALVIMALTTSLISGPAMARILQLRSRAAPDLLGVTTIQ
jgi:Kef-type K+ transport system membrane component KefB